MSSTNTKIQSGFTLVEMLVIAPIAVLVVAGIVSLMINFVGDALISQQRSTATYQTQDGLDQVEQDVRLSSSILSTTGTLTSPQGSGSNQTSSAAAFVADSGTLDDTSALILSAYATTANPIAATAATPRTLVYTNVPTNPCPTPYTTNNPLTYKIVYFVYNGSLWRRTIVPSATTCGGLIAWQKNSCMPPASCTTSDRKVISDVSSVTVTYYTEIPVPYSSTTEVPPLISTDDPTSVKMTVTTSKNVAGGLITSTASIYATRLND